MSEKNLVLRLWLKIFSTNQIAVFFDHQYLFKESTNTLDFLHGDIHQGEVGSESSTFIIVIIIINITVKKNSSNQIIGFVYQKFL